MQHEWHAANYGFICYFTFLGQISFLLIVDMDFCYYCSKIIYGVVFRGAVKFQLVYTGWVSLLNACALSVVSIDFANTTGLYVCKKLIAELQVRTVCLNAVVCRCTLYSVNWVCSWFCQLDSRQQCFIFDLLTFRQHDAIIINSMMWVTYLGRFGVLLWDFVRHIAVVK